MLYDNCYKLIAHVIDKKTIEIKMKEKVVKIKIQDNINVFVLHFKIVFIST